MSHEIACLCLCEANCMQVSKMCLQKLYKFKSVNVSLRCRNIFDNKVSLSEGRTQICVALVCLRAPPTHLLLQPLPAGEHGASAESWRIPAVLRPSCGRVDLLQASVPVAPVHADIWCLSRRPDLSAAQTCAEGEGWKRIMASFHEKSKFLCCLSLEWHSFYGTQ